MTVKVVLEFDTAAEAASFLADFSNGGTSDEAAPEAAGKGKGRGRPRKQPDAQPVDALAVLAAPAAAAAAPAAPQAAAAASAALVPFADLVEPLTELADRAHETAVALLQSFGVKQARDLKPDQIGPMLEKTKAALKALDTPAAVATSSLI